ncbi:MAG: hypothetical protein ACI32W_10005 [Enterococcus faecalis]
MEVLENDLKKYNQLKIDLLKMASFLENCENDFKDMYQNICLEYSKELLEMKNVLEKTYDLRICNCCYYTKH